MTDDIIKRLREAPPETPIYHFADEIAALLDRLAEADEMRNVLIGNGFVKCDISACNCGSWHHRYGLPERMREIKEALSEAGHELSNENGHSILRALDALIARLDKAERERERLREDAERYRWLRRAREHWDILHRQDGDSRWLDLHGNELDAAIDAARAAEKCQCDMRTRLVGDGCQYCNPELARELSDDQ